MSSSVTSCATSPAADLVVVGAGIVGLAHAVEAVRSGLTVRIVERDAAAVGASVRNFGHACVTAQAGELFDLAQVSRQGWLECAERVGFWAPRAGAVVVARAPDELAVLEEFAATRDPESVQLLRPQDVGDRLAIDPATVVGGAFLSQDLRVDPRSTVGAIAAWLSRQPRVTFHWGTTVHGAGDGVVATSRGDLRADRVVVAVGHDLDYVYPELAARHELQRCRLAMALVDAPERFTCDSAVLTATSMLRYDGLAQTSAAGALRMRLTREAPQLLDIGANVMATRRPDGTLLVGDSHHYGADAPPFLDEDVADLLLEEVARVLGADRLRVRQRWQGVYASSPTTALIRESPAPGVDVITVSTGIGMTIAFGLARDTLATF